MAREIFERAAGLDEGGDRLQDRLELAFDRLDGSATSAGTFADVELSTTAVNLEHKLGRQWVGYQIIKRNAGETVYDEPSTDEALYLRLLATGVVIVTLRVW